MSKYIHEREGWPKFRWSHEKLAAPLAAVRHRQGRLIGRMEGLGFQLRAEAVLRSLTEEVVQSSDIEGELLHANETLNDRQRNVLNRLHDGFEGKLTSSKYAAGQVLAGTASRDIDDLIKRGMLLKDPSGGRSTRYSLAMPVG